MCSYLYLAKYRVSKDERVGMLKRVVLSSNNKTGGCFRRSVLGHLIGR